MKKGQEGPGLLVMLISFIIVLAVGIGIYFTYQNFASSRSNIDARQTWVSLRTATGATDITTSEKSPVIDLEEPLEIKSEEDLVWHGNEPPKIFKQMADSMVDCWTANARGEKNYLNSIGKEIDCFPCRAIKFSDKIKKDNYKIIGFNKYLNEQKIRGTNSETYLQFLVNDKTYTLDETDLEDDEIVLDNDLYIFFFAASGRGWTNILTNVIGLGDVTDEAIPETNQVNVAVTQEGEGDIHAARAAGVVSGGVAGKYTLPTLAKKLQEAGTTVASEGVAFEVVEGSAESGAKLITFKTTSKAAPRIVSKVLGRTMGKVLASNGVKFIAGKLFWPVTIVSGVIGGYNVIWGEKPFSAKVFIVEPEKVNSLCNAGETSEAEKAVANKSLENYDPDVEGYGGGV